MSRKTRKFMWSVPLIAAVAVIGALAAFMTLAPNDASAQVTSGDEIPGMVQNLMVEPNTDGSPQTELLVTWEAPTDGGYVTSYRIDTSEDGKLWVSYIADHGDSDLSLIDMELKAEQKRYFRVFAWNEHGNGPGSDASGTTSASEKPDRPTDVSASNSTDGTNLTFRLDFNGDGDTADTDVDDVSEAAFGFDICDNTGGGPPDGDTNDTCENVDETADRTADGFTTILVEWHDPDDPPGAKISGYRIEYSRDGTRWHLLTDSAPIYVNAAGNHAFADRGLLADTDRQYRVYARNTYGLSGVSDGASGSTAPSTAPGEIGNLVVGLSPASTDVHLTWVAPTDPPGAPVTHYRVQARMNTTDDSGTWKNLHSGAHIVRTTVYNFGGDDLRRAGVTVPANIGDDGVAVDIRIAAINRVNANAANDATNVDWVTLDSVPVGDPDVPRKVGRPTVKQDRGQHQGRSGLNMTWPTAGFLEGKGPAEADFNTAVTYIVVRNDEPQPAFNHGPADTAGTTALNMGGDDTKPGYDDDGLRTETERKYVVYALSTGNITAPTVTADGGATVSVRSFPSVMVMGTTARPTLPGLPDSFSVVGDGHTEIKLTWVAPDAGAETSDPCDTDGTTESNSGDGSECGTSVITGYKIEISETGTSGWTTLEETRKTSPYTATMLQPDKRYYFRVSAVNSRGKGDATASESDTTHEAGEPTPPGGLVAQTDTHTSIKLCWFEQNLVDPLTGEAQLDEGLPVLGYQITYAMITMNDDGTEKVGDEKTLVANTESKDTMYTATGLMPNTKYMFWVRSITLGGVGEEHTSASAMTADGPVDTTLKAPTDVTASSDAEREMTLNWKGGENAEYFILIAVDIEAYNAGTLRYFDASAGAADRTGRVSNLNSGTSYLGIVFAAKGTGADIELLHAVAAAPVTVK